MERYAVDFGTSNTVVARWNFAREEPQTMSFPAITAPAVGEMPPVIPSILYYRGEDSFLMGYEVTSIFDPSSLPDYASYDSRDCPLCKAGQRIDALVNSFGYSAL